MPDITGCLQNQANKIPGFFQDFLEFFKQFSRICLHKMSTPNKFVHTIIIWNVQFRLAYFYLTTSLLTLTEADIYWAGRYSLRSYSLYRSCLPNPQNIDKCRQISTLMLFFQDSQQNSRVFPGIPGFFQEFQDPFKFQGFSRISRISRICRHPV